MIILQRPAEALEDLHHLLLPEDREQPVHQDLEPHGDGVGAVQHKGGHVEHDVGGDGLHAGGGGSGGGGGGCGGCPAATGRGGSGGGVAVELAQAELVKS